MVIYLLIKNGFSDSVQKVYKSLKKAEKAYEAVPDHEKGWAVLRSHNLKTQESVLIRSWRIDNLKERVPFEASYRMSSEQISALKKYKKNTPKKKRVYGISEDPEKRETHLSLGHHRESRKEIIYKWT